jgi:hypothetical protein
MGEGHREEASTFLGRSADIGMSGGECTRQKTSIALMERAACDAFVQTAVPTNYLG